MNPNPRQLTLMDVVKTQGSVTVEHLADTLGVTLQTVRRDVQRLAGAAGGFGVKNKGVFW